MDFIVPGFQFLFLLLFLVPAIFFLVTQYNTLKSIKPQNRHMSPGEVWLQLIPVFNLIWQFVVVTRIANSIQKELEEPAFSFETNNQTISTGEKPTYGIGLAYCILICASITPMFGGVFGLAGMICWIIYWVKLSGYKSQIQRKNMTASVL